MRFYRRVLPIQAMTFDLDDTLYDNRPVILRVERKITQWLHQNHPISAQRPLEWWQQVKRDVMINEPMLKHDVTRWRFTQVYQGLKLLGYNDEQADLAATAAIDKVLELRSQFQVPDETHRVLTLLSQRYPLVAITNGNVDVHKIALDPYFSLVLKAGPDGRAKPAEDLFVKASEFLKVAPKHILHVGDHLITDVVGAKNNGFQACWFNDQDTDLMRHQRSRVLPDVEINRLDSLLDL
ncbi:5-amino-6-(5-phospho-D-ribitylamino)uracil phosphatase YigB [Vibrio genomosp. F10]|uniref:2-haloalkanoic acid dehalogenase n=1 Tax=Vibrio genomosp. F10 TaxID=723171 RepID=A0A1B9R1U5_9VIBR|nr:5-amino-6-(5-phospho-D-ribitylamino)uracil phosphatase YigB [Vibrio genomosp. F10]OCH78287.1 2-haloalkanoic acid dehalogenase [Vibrio genomosp. F10]OEF06056.1 2-haloalkanoic acid dehalogenase [Vibrio genomosp. F10 str. 9ZD137]